MSVRRQFAPSNLATSTELLDERIYPNLQGVALQRGRIGEMMSESSTYIPPRVWQGTEANGGQFANINRPTAGSTHEKALPIGRHPLQLYSQGTPNGIKVTILLEELLALGYSGAEYDAWLIRINDGDQFSSGFVEVNPNSK